MKKILIIITLFTGLNAGAKIGENNNDGSENSIREAQLAELRHQIALLEAKHNRQIAVLNTHIEHNLNIGIATIDSLNTQIANAHKCYMKRIEEIEGRRIYIINYFTTKMNELLAIDDQDQVKIYIECAITLRDKQLEEYEKNKEIMLIQVKKDYEEQKAALEAKKDEAKKECEALQLTLQDQKQQLIDNFTQQHDLLIAQIEQLNATTQD